MIRGCGVQFIITSIGILTSEFEPVCCSAFDLNYRTTKMLHAIRYDQGSYIIGALFIVLGVIAPVVHMMRASKRPILRAMRKD